MSTMNKLVPYAKAALAKREETLPPAVIEAEVMALRNECGAMLEELQSRVTSAIAWPRRMREKAELMKVRAVSWVRHNTFTVVATGIACAGLLLLGALVEGKPAPRRRRRGLLDLLFG